MSRGPSKQELEMYWQNSRQYFDELAKHYQQADPAYYKEYIHPFYSNPFRSVSGGKKQGSSGVKLIAAMALLAVIGIAGAAVFFLIQSESDYIPESINKKTAADTVTVLDKPKPLEEPVEKETNKSIHFRRGEQLFKDKNYKLAERYLKQVPESDKNYKKAQELLKEIETIRNNEPEKNDNNKDSDDRTTRRKPIQPIR